MNNIGSPMGSGGPGSHSSQGGGGGMGPGMESPGNNMVGGPGPMGGPMGGPMVPGSKSSPLGGPGGDPMQPLPPSGMPQGPGRTFDSYYYTSLQL